MRTKLFSIAAVTAGAFLALIVGSATLSSRVTRELQRIQERHIPRAALRPQLEHQLQQLARGLQDAVAAKDADQLLATQKLEDDLLAHLAPPLLEPAEAALIREAVADYYLTARDVSTRLIDGELGEDLVAAMTSMQQKQKRVSEQIDAVTVNDHAELADAYAAAAAAQAAGTTVRLWVSLACMALVLAMLLSVGTSVLRSVSAITAGIERFGRGDFDQHVAVAGDDELARVARQANQMADNLKRFDWIKAGQSGLVERLRGGLEPDVVAARACAFLAEHLKASGAALGYQGTDGGVRLLGSHGALTRAELPGTAELVVLPGRAALPLLHEGQMRGVLELLTPGAFPPATGDLLLAVRETLTITLEVALARERTRSLLHETQAQARQLAAEIRSHQETLADLEAFNYSVSHDLRAPLRPLDGFSQILLEDYGDKLDATAQKHLQRIRAGAQRMSHLIDDMLLLSRMTRGNLNLAPVDLAALTRDIFAELKQNEPGRSVELVSVPEATVRGDARLLRIALENLLRNAWKFTRGAPAARIGFGNSERGWFIKDNGAGFDMAYAGKLFQPFQRLHREAEFEGTGIGLAIVKRILRRHGGAVDVDAKLGQGATFYLSLPVTSASPPSPA